MAKIRMTAEQLRELADKIDETVKYRNGVGSVNVCINRYPNGSRFLEFEQPCAYAECFSTYYRFDEEKKK